MSELAQPSSFSVDTSGWVLGFSNSWHLNKRENSCTPNQTCLSMLTGLIQCIDEEQRGQQFCWYFVLLGCLAPTMDCPFTQNPAHSPEHGFIG